MTACAIEPSAGHEDDGVAPAGCTLTADGAYAARLASAGDSWFPERWTLDGPEPYAVPLPRNQPEEPGTEVQPMGDGRVLIHRLVAGRHAFSLLYPTGPGTGELPLGVVECPDDTARLRLLPPAPGGRRAYALAVGPRSTTVWLVAGGAFGPERLAELPGRCSGGVWLDRTGRLLALDREAGGRTKAVVVDLERGGEVSPLLQIAADSDDRLLLADHDSGLLLIRSDAPSPGQDRLGWGVLGSTLPVRFPECLRLRDCAVTPFAIQPGQILAPESCAVALRVDGPRGRWVGVWRPSERRVHHLPAPEGWLAGAGLWTPEGVLRLPYATEAEPCGVAQVSPPAAVASEPGAMPPPPGPGQSPDARAAGAPPATGHPPQPAPPARAHPAQPTPPAPGHPLEPAPPAPECSAPEHSGYHPQHPVQPAPPADPTHPPTPSAPRPVPLQQAPLGRLVTN
ncbi:hypothetical protein AB0E64_31765 [Streptomyces caelestis]|uniref:Uncharacterized protein n=1 Tax=Streptomyces caelestis TaxID=36816 RepID=A0A7W9H2D1_9ACTN|nr:hypothetical protein [Streptomyces caelestis]MBB5794417.1 hypothetical protein [Streptomyces caelestis]GGW30916.1 hypothetical protein GCM10010320_07620 [Streptomyces caelestis]